jgi:hypothetical protein
MDDWNYHRDPRTWDVGSAYTVVESGPDTTKVQLCEELVESLIDEETLTEHHTGVFDLHTKWEVCDQCQGSGTMVNPAIDAGGLSQEDFDEDPDFAADYFGGRYDMTCNCCKGKRVTPSLTFPESIQKAVEDFERDAWDHAAEMAAERAMGA